MRQKRSLGFISVHGQFSGAVSCLGWPIVLRRMLAGLILVGTLQAGHKPSVQSQSIGGFSGQDQIKKR
jgi:hypothetical protein